MEIDVFVSHHTSSSLHIVEGIVNKLESRGIRCWYAPRNTQGAYASSIAHAINSCKIFLLILNRPASESVHVLNEIDMVTKRLTKSEDVKILPFHVADQEIGEDAQYYLGRLHWIDAMTPPMYQRIDELTEHISTLLGRSAAPAAKAEEKPYVLVSKQPPAREVFEGRDTLLTQLAQSFADGNRYCFLEGIGGIGKSELAKQYALRYRDSYDCVVFAAYQTSLRDLICDDNAFTIQNLEPRHSDEDAEDYFRRKLKALQSIASDRMLLIVDNFDTDGDENLQALLEGNYRVLITTRNAHPGYHTIKVEAMRDEAVLLDIFRRNYGDDVDETEIPALREIFRLVAYHTYTIELIAKQMEASFTDAEEMLQLLQTGGMSGTSDESVEGRHDRQSAFGHICSVFNTGKLNEQEQQIMRCLSVVGIGGIPAKRFREWASLPNFDAVNRLIKRSWIRKDGQRLSLHPLVCEVVQRVLRPDVENIRGFLEKIGDFCFHAWGRPYRENLEVTDNILAVTRYFSVPDGREIPIFEPPCAYLWQVGKFDESIRRSRKVYEQVEKVYGEASLEAGFVAKSVGGCYFNSRRLAESVEWYERGLKNMLASGMQENEDLAIAYEKVARCCTWPFCQDMPRAEALFAEALAIRKRLLEALQRGEERPMLMAMENYNVTLAQERIAESYMEMGRMYQSMGNYARALECTRKHYEFYVQHGDNRSGYAYSLYDMGVSHYHLGLQAQQRGDEATAEKEWLEAQDNLEKALEINMDMRGGLAIDTIDNEEYLGDVYSALGRYAEASNAYMAVVTMTEGLLGAQDPRIGQAKRKMDFKATGVSAK